MQFAKKISYILFTCFLGISTVVIGKKIVSTDIQPSSYEIYSILFDMYLPETYLTPTEQRYRSISKDMVWKEVKNNPLVLHAFNQINPPSSVLPDSIKQFFFSFLRKGIGKIPLQQVDAFRFSLRRFPHNDVRRYLFQIRSFFVYSIYNTPISEKLSGYKASEKKIYHVDPIVLPKSKLILEQNHITHRDGTIEYLVIGSGPAGSVIASELALHGYRVVVVEAGPFIVPGMVDTESRSECIESGNTRTTDSGGIIVRNGKAVGGGTIPNINLAFSPLLVEVKKQIRSWINHGYIPHTFIHASESEEDWQKLANAYSWVCQKVGTRIVQKQEVNQNNKILLDGIETATTYALNTKDPELSKGKSAKNSAVDAFLLPAMLHHGLNVISDAKVEKIMFDDQDKATAILIQFQETLTHPYIMQDNNTFGPVVGKTCLIQAEHIILSAGALGSAELLLRSNVKNNNIGKGIVLHPSMGVYGRFMHEINAVSGLSASVYASAENIQDGYFFESMAADPAFLVLMHPGSGKQMIEIIRDAKYIGGFGIMLVDSVSQENKIYLDPHTKKPEISYTLSNQDKERFRKALKKAVEILFDAGAYEVYLPTCELIVSDKSEYVPITEKKQVDSAISRLQFINNETFISSAHLQGSCKMGANPNMSVVSQRAKVWNQQTGQEYKNLFVCDASIFPESIGANPMQSIYSFAKLFIDDLLTKKAV
jgi:choline dehydrogenase-like flavoprotein